MSNNPLFVSSKQINFEFFSMIVFFMLGLFFTNTYTINDFVHFPVTVSCLITSFIMGYYYLVDTKDSHIGS